MVATYSCTNNYVLQKDEWIKDGVPAEEHAGWLYPECQVWAILIPVPPGGIVGQECAPIWCRQQ